MALLEELVRIQRECGMSDRAFARRMGLSVGMWNQIRRGIRPIRYELLSAVVREYPDLGEAVLQFLAEADSEGTGEPL